MRVQNCFHPKVFKNPYTGEMVTARCGKCDACRNTRASNWVTRLDMEACCHKYTLFATFTYDEQSVPQIIRLPFNKDNKNDVPTYIDADTGEYFDFSDLALQKSDIQYLRDSRVLNVLSKRDFQLFIKRLRYYFDKTEKGALLRYYFCGELGPRTYRPHGHLLLFFDSESCAKNIELLLSQAWSNGHGKLLGNIYDPHFVSGSAAEYCASYINSLSQLPRNYLHKGLRPFSLFSKRPALGTLYPSIKEVREVFDRGDIKFTRYDKSSCSFKTAFFWRSYASRLYPRCQRFGSLSHDERVTLYRIIEEFPPHLTARQIARRIKSEFIDPVFPSFSDIEKIRHKDTFLGRYFREIAFKKKKGIHFVVDKKLPWQVKNLPFLPSDVLTVDNIQAESTIIKEYNENSLISFVNVLSRVRHQAQVFGISISDYVSKIELYYENVNKQRLKDDYVYQSQYFLSHPKWHIIYFDKSFYDKVTSTDSMSWSHETYLSLVILFGGSLPLKQIFNSRREMIEVLDIPPLDSLQDFMSFKMLHSKIAKDLVKQKENNDYVLARKDRFGNIIHYQNL